MGLAINENGTGARLRTIEYNDNYAPTDPFKIKVLSNGDGSFRLLILHDGIFDNNKALYQTNNKHYDGSNRYTIASGKYDPKDPAYKWYFISANADDSGDLKMTSSAKYDDDGTHLISSTDTLGNTTRYTYNAKGLVSKVLDPMGHATNYTYDALERTKKVSAPIDSNSEAKVEYDYVNDLLMSIRVNNSAVKYDFTYDSFGRKKSVSVGNGTNSLALAYYTYYDDGLLARQYYGTANSGTYVGYIYDELDRVSKKRYNASDNASAEYSYDPNGNLLSVLDTMWDKTTQYEYDLAGRVVGTATIGNTVRFARAYEGITYNDGKGTVDSYYHKMIDANGNVLRNVNYSFTYGDAASGQIPDALYSMTLGGRGFTFTYDTLGRLTKRTAQFSGGNKSEEYEYIENGTKTSTVVSQKRDFTGYMHYYEYDANGNITSETVGSNVREYTYDSLNRLKTYSDPVANISESYEYDERGNITKVHTGAYNSTTQSTITYTYGSKYQDRFKYYNDIEIDYDNLGNPTKWINGKTMTWQYGRNLITVGDNITYAYNADGLRISKSGARNTNYYIVGGKYIGEVTTIGGTDYVIAYVYDETDSVIGINVNGSAYYFAKNLQGDVLAILNYQGDVIARYTYDVWGKLIAVKNSSGVAITSNTHVAHLNPFRYRGYMYDKETGFYYLRSRYYDPEVGRFLNTDALDTLTATPNALIDIGLATAHKSKGLWYGTEQLIIGLWETRSIWKFLINSIS